MHSAIEYFDTYPGTTIVFGESAFSQFEELVYQQHPDKVMIFTGKNSIHQHKGLEYFFRAFDYYEPLIERFSDIEPEPCTDTVRRMVAKLKEFNPDMVVAMGGGSIMDAAKAAWQVHQLEGSEINEFFGLNILSTRQPDIELKRLVCFPTTAGTGSEVTPYANIVDHALGVKKLMIEERSIPGFAFVCPELTFSLPESVVRATACDALAHLIEGFLNVGQDANHPDANAWALKGIELIVHNLPRRLEDLNDATAAEALAAAATLGGMVIRYKSTGLPHLCSFSWFGKLEHGIAVSLLLPASWKYYLANPAVVERTMQLQSIFPDADSASDIIVAYRKFLTQCGVPRALKYVEGFPEELLEKTASSAAQNKMKLDLAPQPVPVESSREILLEILRETWNDTL